MPGTRWRGTRMRAGLVAALAVAVVANPVLTACGDSPEVAVEKAFRGYHAALQARDFPTACSYNTPSATEKLLTSLRTQAIVVDTCEQALAAIYAEPGPAKAADRIGSTIQVQAVTVDGEDATVSWTAELDGEQRPATAALHRTDGRWQLVAR